MGWSLMRFCKTLSRFDLFRYDLMLALLAKIFLRMRLMQKIARRFLGSARGLILILRSAHRVTNCQPVSEGIKNGFLYRGFLPSDTAEVRRLIMHLNNGMIWIQLASISWGGENRVIAIR